MKHRFFFNITIYFLIALFAVFPLLALNFGNGKVIILLYHDLVQGELSEKDNPEYCTTDVKFEKDIREILAMGFKTLSLADYYNGNYNRSANYFVITFDDGYLSNYTLAFPVLKKLEVHGDIFFCMEFTTRVNHFSWTQAQLMENSGYITLYSHTPKHQSLSEDKLPQFKYNVERSQGLINNILPRKRLYIFSYPGSIYTEESVRTLHDMGVVMQLVQVLPGKGCGWDYTALGLVRRYNVAYRTAITKMFYKISNNIK
jgi:poly-beta-1,6-N-acetyl-D-glucosamine N-deacetylase